MPEPCPSHLVCDTVARIGHPSHRVERSWPRRLALAAVLGVAEVAARDDQQRCLRLVRVRVRVGVRARVRVRVRVRVRLRLRLRVS